MGWGPFRILKGLIILAFASLIMGFFAMLLWNALIPDLFHGPTITYWQSAGLFLLSRILFGHFMGGPRHNHWGGKWGKYAMQQKMWQKMSDQGKWNNCDWKDKGKGKWTVTWNEGDAEEKESA